MIEIINIEQIRRIKYRLDINGLRAVAVISVVIYHIDKTVLKGGWLGVDIFFVISGYLITNIIISDLNTDKFSFKNFYLRRINRILPAVIVTLFFSFFLGYFLLLPGAFKEYLETSLSSLIFLANHYFLNLDFYTAESAKFVPLLHMWSLSIEEQFYILFPFVCFITYKYNKKVLIYLLTILFTISFFFNFLSNGSIIFYLFYFRIWELIAGSLAIFVNLNYSKSPMIQNASFIGIIFCLLNFSDANILEIYPKFLVIVFTFLFIANYSGEKLAIKLLVNKYIQNLGTWSFSIYLLHQPIFSFYKVFEAKSEILNLIGIGNLKKINNFVLFLILLIVSYLNYNFIEKKYIQKKGSLKVLFISFLMLVSLNLYFYYSVNEKNYNQPIFSVPCWNQLILDNCYIDNSSNTTIFFIGDSQIAKIAEVFISENDQYNYFINIQPYGIDINREFYFQEICQECFQSYFNRTQKDIVIFGSRMPHYLADYAFKTNQFENKNSIVNKTIPKEIVLKNLEYLYMNSDYLILIDPIPEFYEFLKDAVYFSEIYNQIPSVKNILNYELRFWNEYVEESEKLTQLFLKNKPDIALIDSKSIVCNKSQSFCSPYKKNNLIYFDGLHLNLLGAELFVENLYTKLK